MVVYIGGILVEELPASSSQLYNTYPALRSEAKNLVESAAQYVSPSMLLYVGVREYAVTTPHDSSVQVLGTDDVCSDVALIIRHVSSGMTLLGQVDRITHDDLTNMMTKLLSQTETGFDDSLQVQIIGGFADSRAYSENSILNVIGVLQTSKELFELTGLCAGETCTLYRGGTPVPAIKSVAINVKSGIAFQTQRFTDRGPDPEIRLARTLTGGEKAGMLDIYDTQTQEIRIGPFSYEPMRSVDLWLNQSDDFLVQSLNPCPDTVTDTHTFIKQIRETLRLVKRHPYPSVTLFPDNQPRIYRRNGTQGGWYPKYPQQTTDWGISPRWGMTSARSSAPPVKTEWNYCGTGKDIIYLDIMTGGILSSI